MQLKKVKDSLDNFAKNKNFELNTDLQNLDPLNKSNILLTDNGGMGLEYSYIHKIQVAFSYYFLQILMSNDYSHHMSKIGPSFCRKTYVEMIEKLIDDEFKKQKVDGAAYIKSLADNLKNLSRPPTGWEQFYDPYMSKKDK